MNNGRDVNVWGLRQSPEHKKSQFTVWTAVTVIISRVASASLILEPGELYSRPPADEFICSALPVPAHFLTLLLVFSQVLVWHTRTEKPHLANEPKHQKDTVVIEV